MGEDKQGANVNITSVEMLVVECVYTVVIGLSYYYGVL